MEQLKFRGTNNDAPLALSQSISRRPQRPTTPMNSSENQKRMSLQVLVGLKKEMNELKVRAGSASELAGQRFEEAHQQTAVYTSAHFDTTPLTYLQVIDAKQPQNGIIRIIQPSQPSDIRNNHQPIRGQYNPHPSQQHIQQNQHRQQFVFAQRVATSSLQDGDGSPYFSDSTLSNCDRDLDTATPCGGSRAAARRTSKSNSSQQQQQREELLHLQQHNHDNHQHQQQQQQQQEQQLLLIDKSSTSSNQPTRCNSATGQPPQRGIRKRVMANERERERTKSLNQALEILRQRILAPEAEKRSKIQTLRMARMYIEFLSKFKYISSQDRAQDSQPKQLSSSVESASSLSSALSSSSPSSSSSAGQYENNRPPTFDKCASFHAQRNPGGFSGKSPLEAPLIDFLTYEFYKFRLKRHSRD